MLYMPNCADERKSPPDIDFDARDWAAHWLAQRCHIELGVATLLIDLWQWGGAE